MKQLSCWFCDDYIIPKMSETIGDKLGYMLLISGYSFGSLEINYENKRSVRFGINYCPVCGRELGKPCEKADRHGYSVIIRSNITEAINRAHMSTRQISKETGIQEEKLRNILIEGEESLTAEELALISDALGVSTDRLLIPHINKSNRQKAKNL